MLRGISISDERVRSRSEWTAVNATTLALMLVRRADLDATSPFDTSLQHMRFVEADLCLQLAKRRQQSVELHQSVAAIRYAEALHAPSGGALSSDVVAFDKRHGHVLATKLREQFLLPDIQITWNMDCGCVLVCVCVCVCVCFVVVNSSIVCD